MGGEREKMELLFDLAEEMSRGREGGGCHPTAFLIGAGIGLIIFLAIFTVL